MFSFVFKIVSIIVLASIIIVIIPYFLIWIGLLLQFGWGVLSWILTWLMAFGLCICFLLIIYLVTWYENRWEAEQKIWDINVWSEKYVASNDHSVNHSPTLQKIIENIQKNEKK